MSCFQDILPGERESERKGNPESKDGDQACPGTRSAVVPGRTFAEEMLSCCRNPFS